MRGVRVCIVGAGISGLCAAKHLKHLGFKNITIFESTYKLGGIWNYREDINYANPLYKNLTCNLPHQLMKYPDFPFPDQNNIDQYPLHPVVLNYIHSYSQHFDLNKLIKYNHKIIKIIPPKNIMNLNNNNLPKWSVYIKNNENEIKKEEFDSIIVCNGHYTKPFFPNFVGLEKFKKTMMHSRYYREPKHELFDNKTIVIIGYRSSGFDIGTEIFFECNNVKLFQVTHGIKVSKQSHRYYIDNPLFIYKQNITQFGDNSSIQFDDGDIIYPDIVIFCTGYLYDFEPFLNNDSLKEFKFNETVNGLFQMMIYPHIPSLFFVGLPLQIVPCLIVHYQCLWIAHILSDLYYSNNNNCFQSKYLPKKNYMIEWIKKNNMMSGEKKQFLLHIKQFDYIKQICFLAQQPIPSDLDQLKRIYLNRIKPNPYFKSRL